ncbi:MAG: family 20 glycosylhydrolase [Kiritimatiellae bacterium]|nr:family 20 glycosylhydrolase [Kiritimatiellia bacterium]MDD5520487.1 family 20 glycosylhydrolase [Kiritimatiellia bacterium]
MRHKMSAVISTVILLSCTWIMSAELPADVAKDTVVLKTRMIPQPQAVKFMAGPEVVIDGNLKVAVSVSAEQAGDAKRIGGLFKTFWQCCPVITLQKDPQLAGMIPDGYTLNASQGTITIKSADFNGVRNALRTIRQIAESQRGVECQNSYYIPEVEIQDAPAIAFRGVHVCWFPESNPKTIEKALHLAAYYKFNYVVLESWGIFPYKSHPELTWKNSQVSRRTLKKLIKTGQDLGVTFIPQLNIFGHATASRHISGKHAVLDFNPSVQSLFEPDGWTWCLSNPATRKVLEDAVIELYDFFEQPPYFHIGCDEAYTLATCRDCRRSDYYQLFKDHIMHFHDVLTRQRNCKLMMWHDMLLDSKDSRWSGYIALGSMEHNLPKLVDELPKDIIICDWQYGAPKKEEKWPTMRYFNEKGFPVLACPWLNKPGITSQGRLVKDENMMGLLCTTWHGLQGSGLLGIYVNGASAGWGSVAAGGGDLRCIFNMHMRQIGWDIPVKNYEDTGLIEYQIPKDESYPAAGL